MDYFLVNVPPYNFFRTKISCFYTKKKVIGYFSTCFIFSINVWNSNFYHLENTFRRGKNYDFFFYIITSRDVYIAFSSYPIFNDVLYSYFLYIYFISYIIFYIWPWYFYLHVNFSNFLGNYLAVVHIFIHYGNLYYHSKYSDGPTNYYNTRHVPPNQNIVFLFHLASFNILNNLRY